MTRGDRQRLDDVEAACLAIHAHLERGGLDDGLVFDAVRIRLVEIGEAVKLISPERRPPATTTTPWSPPVGHPLVQPHTLTRVGRPAAAVRVTPDFPLTGDRLVVLFACQPETRVSTRVYKLMARCGYDGDPARLAELVRYETLVLGEDLAVPERYGDRDRSLAVDLQAESHPRGDRIGAAYRRLLGDLVNLLGDDDNDGAGGTSQPQRSAVSIGPRSSR